MKYEPIPKFGQLVEYITQAEPTLIDGEMVAGVIINQVDLEPESILLAAESIKADYEKIADVRPVQSDPIKIDAIKAEVVKQYCEDVGEYVVLVPEILPILDKITEVKSYKDWQVKLVVKAGEVYLFRPNGNLYKVIQPHTTQADWTPDITPALWNRFFIAGDPQLAYWQEWYAYKVGDEVIYQPNGLKYRCLQAHTSQPTWTPPAVPALWTLV
jgi:hypothetical protein